MQTNLKRITSEAFWVGMGQGVAILGGLVGVRMLTGVLSPVAYGELALGMTFATLANQFIFGPLAAAFMRFFVHSRESCDLGTYFVGVRKLLNQATVLYLALVLVLSLGVAVVFGKERLGLFIVTAAFALSSGYAASLDSMQYAGRQRTVVAWHLGLAQWMRFSMAVAVVLIMGMSSAAAMAGYLLATTVVLLSQVYFFYRKILSAEFGGWGEEAGDPKDGSGQMRSYAWPFAAWGLFTWAQMASDRWALQLFGTSGDVGIYAVLFQVGYTPMMLFSEFILQLFTPILFSRSGDATITSRLSDAHRMNNAMIAGMLGMTVVGTLLTFLVHDTVFSLLVAEKFHGVSGLLPLMVLAGGLFATGQTAALRLMTNINSRALIGPKIGAGVLGVVFNLAGAYGYGLKGVVFANVLFSSLYLIWVFIAAILPSEKIALA